MFQPLYSFIRETTEPFYTVLYGNGVFFIDIWSFVHMFSGIGLMLLICCRSTGRRRFALLFALLMAWEIFELGVVFLAEAVLRPEIIQDQGTDIVIGMLGGMLGAWLHRGGRSVTPYGFASAAFLAMSIAYLWVRSYGYSYNYPGMNSGGLNLWAFSFWSLGLSAVIVVGRAFEGILAFDLYRIAVVWLFYVFGLLAVEYIGYDILDIHEVSKGVNFDPAIAGLIHGTPLMKFFYFSIGPVAVLVDRAMRAGVYVRVAVLVGAGRL